MWLLLAVIVVVALQIYRAVVSMADIPAWVELPMTAMAIVSLVILTCAEIRKISWLGLVERTEKSPTDVPGPESAPSAPPPDAIKEHLKPATRPPTTS